MNIYILDWQINIIMLDSKLYSPQKGLNVLTNWYLKYIFHPENNPTSLPSSSSSTSISSPISIQQDGLVPDNTLTKQAQLRLSCIIPIDNMISVSIIIIIINNNNVKLFFYLFYLLYSFVVFHLYLNI